MHIKRLLTAALAVSLFACPGPMNEPPSTTETSTSRLAADIGPEGGELVAPADHPLAGVRLRVPPGALASKLTITLDGATEATVLSGKAEQVGPQFVVGPPGAEFLTPVELTVPIDEEALALTGQGSTDAKVWHLVNESWKRLEQKKSSEKDVTVDMPTPGAAAAGVLSITRALTCVTDPSACRNLIKPGVIGNDCVNPTGYCLVKLPQPSANPVDLNPGFAVVDRKLYYAHAPAAGRITVARYDLVTGQTVVFTPLNVPGLSGVANIAVAVESDGSAWLGLQQFGNVRFRENQTPFSFDVGANQLGKGVVVVGGKVVRFFTRSGVVQMTDGAVTHSLAPRTALTRASARPTVSGRFLAASHGEVLDIDFATASIATPFTLHGADPKGSFRNDGIAAVLNTGGADVTLWKTPNNGSLVLQSQNHQVAFDPDDTLTGVSTFRPELRLFEAAGGSAVVPLTDAAVGTPAFDRLAPRALLAVKGRKEFVYVARGTESPNVPTVRDFYLLQKGD